jgi:uncharacterized protein (TIGR00288 family)
MSTEKRIALLIDCDNVSHAAIGGVLSELAKYGIVNVRHAHGNWKSSALGGWEDKLHPHAIRPMQQFAYTKGKNATDAAMIIDAMDLLYSGNIEAFALMTSDSDFTPLVLRLRESGVPIYGFGNLKTPRPFVDACTTFIFIERLAQEEKDEEPQAPTKGSKAKAAPKASKEPSEPSEPKEAERQSRNQLRQDTALVKLLRTAAEQAAGDDGWSNMSKVSTYIRNNSSFASINYGYSRLSDLVRATELFKIEMRNNDSVMYIKDARK